MIPKTINGLEKEIIRLKNKEEYLKKKKEYLKLKSEVEPNFWSLLSKMIKESKREKY